MHILNIFTWQLEQKYSLRSKVTQEVLFILTSHGTNALSDVTILCLMQFQKSRLKRFLVIHASFENGFICISERCFYNETVYHKTFLLLLYFFFNCNFFFFFGFWRFSAIHLSFRIHVFYKYYSCIFCRLRHTASFKIDHLDRCL